MSGNFCVPSLRVRHFRISSCCILLLLICGLHASPQDSLRTCINNAQSDTARARAMVQLARRLMTSSPDEATSWADSVLSITREKGPDDLHAAAALTLGDINNGKGIYQLALKYFLESLSAYERTGNVIAQSKVKNSIGNTYLGMHKNAQALDAFREAARLAKEADDLHMQAIADVGISTAIIEKDTLAALTYIKESRQLFHQIGEGQTEAFAQCATGLIYYQQKNYALAEATIDSALAIFRKGSDLYRIFAAEKLLGDIYSETNRPDSALQYLLHSETLCREMDAKDNLAQIYSSIAKVYESKGDYAKSLAYYKLFKQYNDSVFNSESNRQLLEAQEEYGSEKKQREIEVQKQQISQQAIRQDLLLGGMALLLVIAFLIFRQYRAKRITNRKLAEAYKSLEFKNELIELKNKEITDSIHYAKRIQESFLPDEELFKALAPESLLLYQPKDIVSGDFYWMNRVGSVTVFAVADCTGHGVPGAFLSAICNDLLNHVIRESGIIAPAEILYRLDEKLRQQGKSGNSHDGMDVAICAIDENSSTLRFAGARRPLLIFRGTQMTELNASKFSIGENVMQKQFSEQAFSLQQGDTIYLFSDGFADQFGGPRGKKFKYRRFQELLQKMQDQPMDRQCEMLEQTFSEWKGALEQVDDVCVMGLRFAGRKN